MSEKIILRTGGMSCASCSAKIERTIGKLNGVLSVNANFSENTVFVEFEPEKISSEYISDAIRKSGYDVLEGDNDTIMEKERKESIALKRDLTISVVFTAILMVMAMGPMLGLNIPFQDNAKLYSTIQLILCIPVIFSGRRFYIRGIPSLLRGNPTMDTLIALGTLAAIIYSFYSIVTIFQGNDSAMHSLFFDSAAMIITLVSVGKYLESRSKVRTNDAVKGLMDLAPPTAEIERGNETVIIPIEEVNIGDITVIRPGNRIPIDGKVIEGLSHVDESMLTGESMPVKKTIGDEIYSGTTNSTGVLRAEVTCTGTDTALSKIVRMIKDAQSTKAPVARIADKVASIFVPVVIIIAVASAVLWMLAGKGLEFSLIILISVLVISCPCALGLATPLAITVGTGRAAEYGILFKDAATLERSGNISEIILDKTGTLTEGRPKVERIMTDMDEKEFIAYVASAESVSEHPLGKAVISYAKDQSVDIYRPEEFTSITGKGVVCIVKGKNVIVGNDRLLIDNKVEFSNNISEDDGMTRIHVAINGTYVGFISLGDPVRKTSHIAISHLKKMDIKVTMVTGDSDSTAKKIAKETGIENVVSRALPQDKINIVKKIQAKGVDVAMVGDGINDSPALIQADIGIAIGSGTDIAIDSADIILMNDDMRNIPATFSIGKATIRNIRQNLFFAFCYNVVCIPIAAGLPFLLGLSSFTEMPMIAAFAMSCSSISVVLNSLRLKRFKPDCCTG
jgi:P-type Cu+ transporter